MLDIVNPSSYGLVLEIVQEIFHSVSCPARRDTNANNTIQGPLYGYGLSLICFPNLEDLLQG